MSQKLTKQGTVDLLTKLGALKPCPACGHQHWNLLDEDAEGLPSLLLQRSEVFNIPPPRLPLVVLVCVNCGFLRQHAKLFLERLLNDDGRPVETGV